MTSVEWEPWEPTDGDIVDRAAEVLARAIEHRSGQRPSRITVRFADGEATEYDLDD